ncbi:MAG: hypothetical protein J0L97_02460, partial [Alphaproteobacteria bacterium]|nr:hypothetical protein [Alphaproteobacteria bacterium]
RDLVPRVTGITPRYKFRGQGEDLAVTVSADVEGAVLEVTVTLMEARERYSLSSVDGKEKNLLGYAAYAAWIDAYAAQYPDSPAEEIAADMKNGLTPLQIIRSNEALENAVEYAVDSVVAAGRRSLWEKAATAFLQIYMDPDMSVYPWLAGEDGGQHEKLNFRYSMRIWRKDKEYVHDFAGLEAAVNALFGAECYLEGIPEKTDSHSGEINIHFSPAVSYPALKDRVAHFFLARAAQAADMSQDITALVFADKTQAQVAYHYLVEQGVLPYPERPDNAEIVVSQEGERALYYLNAPSAPLFHLLEAGRQSPAAIDRK